MSHKASAYMRELTIAPNGERLTRNEKLFGLILADYHQAGTRHTFPSLATLAADSLMDERSARRVLHSMERKGVVKRIRPVFQYRGITTFYIFPAIDGDDEKGDTVAPLKPNKGDTVAPLKKGDRRRAEGGQKGDKTRPVYKEELVTVTNKSYNPLPPEGGQGNGILPTPHVTEHDHANEALAALSDRLGVTNERTLKDLREVLMQHKRRTGSGAYPAAEQMADAWFSYLTHPQRIGKPMSMRMFYTEGHWLRPDGWLMLTVEDTKPRRIM